MSQQRSRDTAPEMRLRRALHARGLRYFVHRRPLPGVKRTADVVFPRLRVAVFVDGCFWHSCPQHGKVPRPNAWYWPAKLRRNLERDAETDRLLDSAGWTSVRVWEHEDPGAAADRITSVVQQDPKRRNRRAAKGSSTSGPSP